MAIFFDFHPPPLYITGYKAEITYIYNFSSGSLKWWAEVVVVEEIVGRAGLGIAEAGLRAGSTTSLQVVLSRTCESKLLYRYVHTLGTGLLSSSDISFVALTWVSFFKAGGLVLFEFKPWPFPLIYRFHVRSTV